MVLIGFPFLGNSSLSLQNPTEPASRVPNTNKHSVQGSNPIWLKGYENEWFKTEENLRFVFC